MKIAIQTLGCRTNQAESLEIEALLKQQGRDIVDISDNPDICILNTCSVTAKADQQSRQLIRRALKNNSKVIVTGCFAELNADIIKEFRGSIEIVKNIDKNHIINKIIPQCSSASIKLDRYARSRPILKVQDGCNFSCSYCTIPLARGKSRSVPVEDILQKINTFEESGFKEVVLTGIHLGTYGIDLIPSKPLSQLLDSILKYTSIPRIRLSSIEINEITDEMLEVMENPRICNHLHIPLQSGDDEILLNMNRHYDTAYFSERLKQIVSRFPGMAIGTDIITGFPGEKRENFIRTVQFLEGLPLAYLHVFPYSSRPGTKAASFPDQVPESLKKERVVLLGNLAATARNKYLSQHMDKTLQVIVENKTIEGCFGTSTNYIKVLLASEYDLRAQTLMNIRVTRIENNHVVGIPLI